jgi:hypothetical protein
METTNPPVKPSPWRRFGRISLWVLAVFVGLLMLGYFIPHIAHWGFTGSVEIMEGRLDRLTLPAERVADLKLYVSALKRYVATTFLDVPQISAYVQASDPLDKVLRAGRADDQDMLAIRRAFADAQIAVEAPPAPPAPAKKK